MLGTEFAALFLKRRVQPLQYRAHPMYLYTGAKDSTRISLDDLKEKELQDEVRRLTKLTQKDNIPLEPSVRPFEASYPPPEVCFYAFIWLAVDTPIVIEMLFDLCDCIFF